MQRIGLIGLDGENLPVDLLGGLEPARLMVLNRQRQGFGNCCHNNIKQKDAINHCGLWRSEVHPIGLEPVTFGSVGRGHSKKLPCFAAYFASRCIQSAVGLGPNWIQLIGYQILL